MEHREKLFNYKKIYDLRRSESFFVEAMKESVTYHLENCAVYNKFLEERQCVVSDIKTIEDVYKIPPIPANFFKLHEVLSVPREKIVVHATSSGTLGQKSQIFLDQSSLALGKKMIIQAMKYHKMISLIPTNYLLLGYEPVSGNDMGNVKVLMGMTKFAPRKEVVFALKFMGGQYQIDYFGIIEALKRYSKQLLPVRIFGFPAYLYLLLTMMKKMNIKPLSLNKKSLVFTGGGWKNHKDLAIDKLSLYALVEEMLGIPTENCRDFYSAVEHSVAYPECKNHKMHVPIWSRVVIRDVVTFENVGFDKPGFLNFISPLVSSMPISSIVMGDMAILIEGKKCGCGIDSPYFEVIGRAGTTKGKSCALTAAQLIGGGIHGTFI